jgi:iron-sulfur cluster assembly accessory protein
MAPTGYRITTRVAAALIGRAASLPRLARPAGLIKRQRYRGAAAYNGSMINVTETAAGKIHELLTEENKVGAGLRVFVQGGGCSGFQYGLMIDEGEGDEVSDQVFEVNGVRLFVDPISLRYLKGAEVDFVDNQMGGGFTIKNPNARSTCGCGSSFNV